MFVNEIFPSTKSKQNSHHTFDVRGILRRTLSGASWPTIARELGISKSSVQHYLDRIKQANLPLEQAIGLKPNDLESRLSVGTGVRSGFHEPDFETVYSRHKVHGKNRRPLKALWDSYRNSVPKGATALVYKGFCKAYARFCQNLPPSCREVELTNQWDFGYVAMIDYSGDNLPWTPDGLDKVSAAQIFVGVLPASGHISVVRLSARRGMTGLMLRPRCSLFWGSPEAYLSGQLDLAGDQGQVLSADLQAIPGVLRLLRHNSGRCQAQ